MVYWIKKIARISGLCVFFLIFIYCIDYKDPYSAQNAIIAALKAGLGAGLFWFLGFIIGDIIIKGIFIDLPTNKDDMIEGGLVQRLYTYQERSKPGESDSVITGELLYTGREKHEQK